MVLLCSSSFSLTLPGVEPYAYIKDVLQHMTNGHPMSRIDELLPWNWTASTGQALSHV